jgi:hypothetical protein
VSYKIQFLIICSIYFIYILHYFIKSSSILNIGFWLVSTTFIYTIYPIINYYFGGNEFGIFSDNRLSNGNITELDIDIFYSYYLVYFLSLTFFVIIFNLKTFKDQIYIIHLKDFFKINLIIYFIIRIILLGVYLLYNINFDRSQHTEGSIDANLSSFSSAPYIIVQIAVKLNGILSVAKISAIVFMVLNFKKYKYFIISFILIEGLFLVINLGSRTSFFNLLFVFFLVYQQFIRKVKFKSLSIYLLLFLFLFIYLGYVRGVKNDSDSSIGFNDMFKIALSINNEFQVLFATGIEVLKLSNQGTNFPAILYFNDIVTILPPSQLLPFEKIEAADWYLINQGYKNSGTGFMWGVISQSLIGFGHIELALRGFFLALIAKFFHNKITKGVVSYFGMLLYILLCLKAYYTFRNTTLGFISFVVYEFIPFVILFGVIDLIINGKVNFKKYLR